MSATVNITVREQSKKSSGLRVLHFGHTFGQTLTVTIKELKSIMALIYELKNYN